MASCTACSWQVDLEDTFCARCGAPVIDPLIGIVVGERYRIVSRLGVGGMGAVYRAEHTMMRRDLAIKVLLPELSGRDEFARRFEREAESASRLGHPNIITVTDFGRMPDGSLFLAMEYLGGVSLTSVISEGPVPRPRALGIIRQILRALDHAHAAGVIHRDLKPDNIMLVERDGHHDVVKILDFGIAKVTEPLSGQQALTQAGVIFGTPEYLSPEQALGEVVDGRADLYAAGVILYEMLVGRRPFESDDKVKIISMHLSHAPPRMRDVNPTVDVPPALEQAVLQAMEKHREHRFATATAFLQALEDAELGSEPVAEQDAWATAPHDARTTAANAAAWLARTTGRLGDRRWRRAWTAMALVVGVAVTVAVFRKPRRFSAATHAAAPASVHATTARPPASAPSLGPEAMPPPLSRTAAEEEVDQLARTANEGSDLPRRLRAAAKLEEMGNRDRIDQVSLTILELKQARTCEQRKSYVEKLRAMGDPRALPALRGLHGLRLGRLVRVGGANTGCMKKELAAAIKTLESKS
ncbi:MAG TPA: serine/threonine-protein kinase [Polyangia bacterium]|nr:serine/threonine-protein kinase [Polyangia bacterium]